MLDKTKVKELALASGFKLKEQADGSMDLNPYVYQFAVALERLATALAFEQAGIPKKAKAGCIGEFKFTIEDARCCPECYNNGPTNDCEMCGGTSGESGVSDLTVSVPWDLCKEIWLAMNQFAANELRQQVNGGV